MACWICAREKVRNFTICIPIFINRMDCISYDGRKVNTLMMGEDVAKGLGQRTILMKSFVLLIIVLLCGGSVAVAGPIGFIGIITPHFARFLVGVDHRWRVPYSGLLGAILLILADIAARYVIMPQEVPVGVMTAFIGAPFFIYIARKRGLSK